MKKAWLGFILGCTLSLQAHAGDRIMVQFTQLAAQHQLNPTLLTLLTEQKQAKGIAVYELSDDLSEHQKLALIQQLRLNPDVNWVERDQIVKGPQFIPNDSLIDFQIPWQSLIKLDQAWLQGIDCSPVVVSIIDSGLDLEHPDLVENIWLNEGEAPNSSVDMDSNGYIGDRHGWNPVSQNGSVADLFGHGTHVAGLIGAVGNNALGVAGSCWNVKLLPVKFLDRFGNGSISNAVQAIYYVMDIKKQFPAFKFIINNSWGAGASSAIDLAVSDATQAGIFVVNAAGNSGMDINLNLVYPAQTASKNLASLTIANADTTKDLDNLPLHSRSNYGDQVVSFAAPGTNILSTWPTALTTSSEQGYQFQDGTSMAAPIVSGIAAMLWSANPTLTPQGLRANLEATVQRIDSLKPKLKAPGLVDANQALNSVHYPFVALSHLQVEEGNYYIVGHKLDLVQSFMLNHQPLDITQVNSTRVSLGRLDQLRCGWLEAAAPNNNPGLYLDWSPAPPQIQTLTRSLDDEYVLSWQADEAVDRVEIVVTQADGSQYSLAQPTATQTATLNLLEGESVRIRGFSLCVDRHGQEVERASDFSATKSVGDIITPTWITLALGQVELGLPFQFKLQTQDADVLTLQSLGAGCQNDEVTLDQDGILQGIKSSPEDCNLSILAESSLSQLGRVQNLKLSGIESEQLWRTFVSTEADDRFLQNLTFKASTPLSMQLLKKQSRYGLFWQTDERLFEVELRALNRFSIVDLIWPESGESVAGLVNNGEYARFIVEAGSAGFDYQQDYQLDLLVNSASPEGVSSYSDTRCFIASHVYGDTKSDEVRLLRKVRDWMQNQWPGSSVLVNFYYKKSPVWVEWAKNNPTLSKPITGVVKIWLDSFVWLADWFEWETSSYNQPPLI
ncbi:MAG: S8 family serine peptidase [Methyloprofundus sp.]|nr:S8 family serine peptidase [Methyloprofundus sp.]